LKYKHSGTYGKPSNSQARILSHWKDWLPERVVTGAVSYKDGRFIYAPGVAGSITPQPQPPPVPFAAACRIPITRSR
jgi:hypothetical protein